MNLIKLLFIAMVGLSLTTNVLAQQDIREIFVCSYNDGNDMDDLMAARDSYLEQAEKNDLELNEAFVWTPISGRRPFDFLWFNNYDNLVDYGEAIDARGSSPVVQAILARFAEVATCTSSLASRQTIYAGSEAPVSSPPAFISAYACNFQDGVRKSDMVDLREHLKGAMSALGDREAYLLYETTPINSDQNSADLYLYGVNDNAATWGARTQSLVGSETGQSLIRHFDAILDCTNSHWSGIRVVPAL